LSGFLLEFKIIHSRMMKYAFLFEMRFKIESNLIFREPKKRKYMLIILSFKITNFGELNCS
jgi:hypothetical protein